MLLFAAVPAAAEYALFEGGVGLSGVGYGLFGLLWVLARTDPRFAGAIDGRTVALFLGWFVLCCAMTAIGAWKIANAAHAAGAVLGILLGFAIAAQGRPRVALGGLLFGTAAGTVLAATVGRPYVNLAGQVAPELSYLAYLDLEHGRNESAAARYQQALELDPGQADWWYNLGIARARLDQIESSTDASQRALDLRPGDEALRRFLAALKADLAYRRQVAGDQEKACRLYRAALALDDRQAVCWYNLGLGWQTLGRTEAAREAYQRAIALEPTNEHFRAALKSLPRATGDPKQAPIGQGPSEEAIQEAVRKLIGGCPSVSAVFSIVMEVQLGLSVAL